MPSFRPHWPPFFTPVTGSLNLLVRSRNKGALDTHAWSLSGNKGNVWQQAHVPINPSGPFQVSLLGPEAPPKLSQALGCCWARNHFRRLGGLPGGRCREQAGYRVWGWGAARGTEGKRWQSIWQNLPNPCSLLCDPTPDYF